MAGTANIGDASQRSSVYTGCPPAEGARVFPISIDFNVGNEFDLDFSQVQALGFASWIQSLYVDNLDNTVGVDIVMGLSNQRITFPAGFQGYMPILLPNPPSLKFISNGSTTKIKVFLLNYFMPPAIWSATGTSKGGGGAVGFTGMVGFTSSAIVSGSSFEFLVANPNRKQYYVTTRSANNGSVFVGFTNALQNIELSPGMTLDEDGPNIYQGKIYVRIQKAGDHVGIWEGS